MKRGEAIFAAGRRGATSWHTRMRAHYLAVAGVVVVAMMLGTAWWMFRVPPSGFDYQVEGGAGVGAVGGVGSVSGLVPNGAAGLGGERASLGEVEAAHPVANFPDGARASWDEAEGVFAPEPVVDALSWGGEGQFDSTDGRLTLLADRQIGFTVTEPTWLEVRDERGVQLINREVEESQRLVLEGTPPFWVYMSNGEAATVEYDNQTVRFAIREPGLFARFQVGRRD